jgi:hypothetical protein
LKERVYKPIVISGNNRIIATFLSFGVVTLWHSPMPFSEGEYNNWNSIYSYLLFGAGNFVFTVLENVITFKILGTARKCTNILFLGEI